MFPPTRLRIDLALPLLGQAVAPQPVSVMSPLMVRLVLNVPPIAASLSSVIGPGPGVVAVQVQQGAVVGDADAVEDQPLGRPGPARFFNWSCELTFTVVVPAVGTPGTIAPIPSALGLVMTDDAAAVGERDRPGIVGVVVGRAQCAGARLGEGLLRFQGVVAAVDVAGDDQVRAAIDRDGLLQGARRREQLNVG